jgi:hypothetical protein
VLSKAVDVREEKNMFSLVIKEKPEVLGGWLEVEGEESTVRFDDDFDAAMEVYVDWSNWIRQEVDSVLRLENPKGLGLDFKPMYVESIALVYTRG